MYLKANFEIFVLLNPFRFLAYFIIESLDKKKKKENKRNSGSSEKHCSRGFI